MLIDRPNEAMGGGVIRDAVQSLLRRSLKQAELRGSDRFPLSMTMAAHRLNDRMEPTGEAIELLTRDISETGIGIVTTFPLEDRFLLLRIPNQRDGWTILAEVLWRQQLGNSCFYRFGARFIPNE